MKRILLLAPAAALLLAVPARAVDHNNLDSGRPLRFEDAEAIAYREQALEFGFGLGWPRRRALGLSLDAEYLYGFARNSHLILGFEPSIGGRADDRETRFDFGDVSVGYFHNFNRQYGNTPAFSIRADAFAPSGRDSQGLGIRVRGIASRQAGQYGRLHLNVDLNANPGAPRGQREFHPGLVLGFSHPIGYPTRFDTTGLAELSVQAGRNRGTGPVVGLGIGARRQVGNRSVIDLGIQSDIAGANGAPRDRIRIVAGYSYGF